MAEIEYQGIKVGGSKLLLIVPLVTSIVGGLWGGFEFYKDYTDMKAQIMSYVAPDLSGIEQQGSSVSSREPYYSSDYGSTSKDYRKAIY